MAKNETIEMRLTLRGQKVCMDTDLTSARVLLETLLPKMGKGLSEVRVRRVHLEDREHEREMRAHMRESNRRLRARQLAEERYENAVTLAVTYLRGNPAGTLDDVRQVIGDQPEAADAYGDALVRIQRAMHAGILPYMPAIDRALSPKGRE